MKLVNKIISELAGTWKMSKAESNKIEQELKNAWKKWRQVDEFEG